MRTEPLLDVLGGWSRQTGPLHLRLSRSLRRAVEAGALGPGTRLPAERRLAAALSISRSTVVAAYQALREDGLVESRQGSGTWVPGTGPVRSRREDEGRTFHRNTVLAGRGEAQGDVVEFLGASLSGRGVLTPEILRRAADDTAALVAASGYQPLGLLSLREAIARHMERWGLKTRPDEILVTNGAQQAIALTASLFVGKGDTVALESPTYLTAIDLYNERGAALVALATGSRGVAVEAVRDAVERRGARLVYLMPTFQNPTGGVLPERARRELARLSAERNVVIVEDHAHTDLALDAEPPPPIAAFAKGAPVLTIGSMSKLFWGGLRVGWIRGPEPLIRQLTRRKAMLDLGSSLPSQALAARLFGDADRIVALRRDQLATGVARLSAELKRHLPTWRYTKPAGGLTLWVTLPHGSATALVEVALRHGVTFVPGPVASPDDSNRDHLRLTFVLPPDVIREGVERLARAWAAFAAGPEKRLAAVEVLV